MRSFIRRMTDRTSRKQIVKSVPLAVISFFWGMMIMVIIDFTGMSAVLAWIIQTPFWFCVRFTINKIWVFEA